MYSLNLNQWDFTDKITRNGFCFHFSDNGTVFQ